MNALPQFLQDGLANMLARLGVAGDKAAADTVLGPTASAAEILNAYRTTWFRKIVDIPPSDMTREWRSWQGTNEEITAIETTEKRLDLRRKLRSAMILGRLWGGGAIFMGGKALGNPEQELLSSDVPQDGLEYLLVLGRMELRTPEVDRDVASATYGQPKFYEISSGQSGGRTIKIHPSRVIRFIGNELPDTRFVQGLAANMGVKQTLQYAGFQDSEGWGDPLWYALQRAVLNADLSSATIASLLHEAKIDVVKIKGFMQAMATQEGEDRIVKRTGLNQQMKSTNNALVIDADDDYQQKSISFDGLPDLMRIFLAVMAGMADIPATRLLGKSPDGMNATGDSDLSNYYDGLAAIQEVDIRPTLEPLDRVLLRSALGRDQTEVGRTPPPRERLPRNDRPPAPKPALDADPNADPETQMDKDVTYAWNPLWQEAPSVKATTFKTKAEAIKIITDVGVIPDSAMATAVQNMLIEDEVLPGLEAALDAADQAAEVAPIEDPEPSPEELAAAAQAGQGVPPNAAGPAKPKLALVKTGDGGSIWRPVSPTLALRLADATPRSLYVRRDVTNAAELRTWAKGQGLTLVDDPHVTIAFSRTPIDWMKVPPDDWSDNGDGSMLIPPGGARLVERLGGEGAIVLLFNSWRLGYRNQRIIDAGASSDYDEYQPHVTIVYDKELSLDAINAIEPYRGKIALGPEIFEEIRQSKPT